MKKILAVTSIRSDYDLMSPLYNKLLNNNNFNLMLLVSGAHLSKSYGNSVDLIRKDGYKILLEIETLIDSDSSKSRLKTASLLLQNSIDVVHNYSPDLIVYAGDREDNIIGALLGAYLQIPTAHFYGGDHVQDGHVDNPIRHAVSKLSTYHFVSIQEHCNRLIRIGEHPKRIFNIGAISLDKIFNHKKIEKNELIEKLDVSKKFREFCLVIFHPLDKEMKITGKIFQNILNAIEQLKYNAFVNYPNTDPSNKKIVDIIEKYKDNKSFYFFKNLPRDLFLSLYKNSIFQIGNSSSGIVESASIPIPVVNVGERQKGRAQSGNVIFCGTKIAQIKAATKKAISKSYIDQIKNIENIYGDGKSAQRAQKILKDLKFDDMLYKTEDPMDIPL